MRTTRRCSALVLLACLTGCHSSGWPALERADVTAIHAATAEYERAANAGDWGTVASQYTAQAVLLPPNAPAITGREAIQRHFEAYPPMQVTLVNTEVDGRGDLAYVRGEYVMIIDPTGPAPMTDRGKYLEVRRRMEGGWLISRDMYGSDLQAPQPQ